MLRVSGPMRGGLSGCPAGTSFPVLGVLSCVYLMLQPDGHDVGALPGVARHRHAHLLVYGRTHSPLADRAEQAAQSGGLRAGNFLTALERSLS